ncbi:MAG: transposase [Candidatus Competibacteraceae bacterium]|nr:transposase [Candidatus Competibacteraceae bacterium]
MAFCGRFGDHFRQRTRTVETAAQQSVHGLIQTETKNMERMEEAVLATDHQVLHHMLSESGWLKRAVLDQIAQEANPRLGGDKDTSLTIDESGFPKKAQWERSYNLTTYK